MSVFLYSVIYLSILVFAVACAVRGFQYARAPVHLRWELYPVPHEESDRVEHGGSYFETVDWWTKPAHFSLWGELKSMIPEIVFLKGLWEFNRELWFRSFPFHFGLYLLIVTVGLLAFDAILSIFAPVAISAPLAIALQPVYHLTGALGLALGILGAAGLLVRRLTDQKLKIYTTPGDIFNLLFFIVALGLLSAGLLSRPDSAPDMLTLSKGLLSFDASIEIPGLLAAGLFISAALVAYVPLTHMSHFIAKYFTYHSVRWDDSINRRGGSIEAKVAECLTYRPTWAASHIGADGNKTWAQIATTNPAAGAKK